MALALGVVFFSPESGWKLPGFRSGKLLQAVIAVVIYVLILDVGLTFQLTNPGGRPGELWLYRIYLTLMMTALALYAGNYRNIWSSAPLSEHPKKAVRVLGIVLLALLAIAGSFVVFALIVQG